MFDLLIKGGRIINGSGQEAFSADVGIKDGKIASIGKINDSAQQTIDADGALVTPGFVDIHTHYDGQVSWDETFSPSIYHGVTTVVMGNCGVGFAPVQPGSEDRLISLMEGVEDIPGTALAEGICWGWTSFAQYMKVIENIPHSIDFLAQVPHDALRVFVMGKRAEDQKPATQEDIAAMRNHLREALEAGAIGFSTGRTDLHRTAEGKATPASEATLHELVGLGQAFQGLNHGVVQFVSDYKSVTFQENFETEFDLLRQTAKAAGRPLSVSWSQHAEAANQWKEVKKHAEELNASGSTMRLQSAVRGIGVLTGFDTTLHPFIGFPSYIEVSHLPLAERAARLRDPETKKRLLSESSKKLAGDGSPVPPMVDVIIANIDRISARMFPFIENFDYEPTLADSFAAQAQMRGIRPMEALYDYLCEGDGSNIVYFPLHNYVEGSLDVVYEMLNHPLALASLSDGGAHVGTICDASFPTSMLTFWTRDRKRGPKIPLTQAIEMLSARNARYLGLTDRGLVKEGMKADINVIDYQNLKLNRPSLVRDLPAGGKRFVQSSEGYLATLVSGVPVIKQGSIASARPGKLVRVN
jgi:N-acyl-D-aspartate/D-glutamate deacylase